MNTFKCVYIHGPYGIIKENINAESLEKAKDLFIAKWGIVKYTLVLVTAL